MSVIPFGRPVADRVVTDVVDLGTVLGVWAHPDDEAFLAQASQTGGLIAAVGEDRIRRWWATEAFVSADSVASRARDWGTWRVAA